MFSKPLLKNLVAKMRQLIFADIKSQFVSTRTCARILTEVRFLTETVHEQE